jgi:GntR family transcriptional regulator
MDIVLSPSSDKPIYTQIFEQISGQILSGAIPPGTKLPPIRTVALDLRVSVIPVKQAWEQLEREGFITTAAGRGTYVQELKHHEIDRKRTDAAEQILTKDIAACKSIGMSYEEIRKIVERCFEKS